MPISWTRVGLPLALGSALICMGLLLGASLRSEGHTTMPQVGSGVPLPVLGTAPDWVGKQGDWMNTGGKSLRLYGTNGRPSGDHIYVVAFWTFACINCKRTVPYWSAWAKKYAGTDVRVVSVHTPELDFERNRESLRRELQQKGITFPVLTDDNHQNWNAFGVTAWPTTILVDRHGQIRGRWEGELNWQNSGEFRRVEQAIEALRKEKS